MESSIKKIILFLSFRSVKRLVSIVVLSIAFLGSSSLPTKASHCSASGISLWGRVRVVPNGGDLRVQKVSEFPDIRVLKVRNTPDTCGRWLFVSQGEDFTVEYVSIKPDIRVRFVQQFPGT